MIFVASAGRRGNPIGLRAQAMLTLAIIGCLPIAVRAQSASPQEPATSPRQDNTDTHWPLPFGNPLWSVPVENLQDTRSRPIFAPSRRPPEVPKAAAPVVAEPAPPPPPEPEKVPTLSLLGVAATANGSGSAAVFFDDTSKEIVRLKTGEGHQGWLLSSVKPREVTLKKDDRTMVVALPPPGEPPKPQ